MLNERIIYDKLFSNHDTKVQKTINPCKYLLLKLVSFITFILYMPYFYYICSKIDYYGERKNSDTSANKRQTLLLWFYCLHVCIPYQRRTWYILCKPAQFRLINRAPIPEQKMYHPQRRPIIKEWW